MHENPGSSVKAIRRGVEGFGDHTVDAALDSLEEDGMVAWEKGPRNSKLYGTTGRIGGA